MRGFFCGLVFGIVLGMWCLAALELSIQQKERARVEGRADTVECEN
jgi:tetrahydromethanopterin S-methyltransferase subunit B